MMKTVSIARSRNVNISGEDQINKEKIGKNSSSTLIKQQSPDPNRGGTRTNKLKKQQKSELLPLENNSQ